MDESSLLHVLLLATEHATALRWAEALADANTRVATSPADLSDDAPIDLVITDREGPNWPADEPRAPGATARESDVGVIRVGAAGPADLSLPDDATPRELRLACGLLAQVVRLRRALRRREDLHRRLAAEALLDPLTGLPNRRAWDRAMAERLGQASPSAVSCSIAIVDLDHFKQVNDAGGHPLGDRVLRRAGQLLRHTLRRDDFVARLGGDEFGLLLACADEPTAMAVVDRVRSLLPNGLAQEGLPAVTASAGLCCAACGLTGATRAGRDAILAAADVALRAAKAQGRNRTVSGRPSRISHEP